MNRKSKTSKPRRRRPAIRGIGALAEELDVRREHIYLVSVGKRQSRRVSAALAALKGGEE